MKKHICEFDLILLSRLESFLFTHSLVLWPFKYFIQIGVAQIWDAESNPPQNALSLGCSTFGLGARSGLLVPKAQSPLRSSASLLGPNHNAMWGEGGAGHPGLIPSVRGMNGRKGWRGWCCPPGAQSQHTGQGQTGWSWPDLTCK